MKKLLSMTMLLTVMFLTFSACSNDDDDVATTYTLSFDVHSNLSSTVRLFEYNDNGDKIGNKSIECKAGDIHTFTADPETYKVKVYLSIGNIIGKWVQQVFILKKGGDTKISIDDINWIYVYLFSDFLFARAILRAEVCDSLCVR